MGAASPPLAHSFFGPVANVSVNARGGFAAFERLSQFDQRPGKRQQFFPLGGIGGFFRFRECIARLAIVLIDRSAQFKVAPALWSITHVVDLSARLRSAPQHWARCKSGVP